MTTNETIYGVCRVCGRLVMRTPGLRHGDGQVDTDESPVWLVCDETDLPAGLSADALSEISCGCNN